MRFDEYQAAAVDTDWVTERDTADDPRAPERAIVIPLLGLVGEAGSLAAEYKKLLRDGATHQKFRVEIAEELGDLLWYISNLASKFDLSLEAIARANLSKTRDRSVRRTEHKLYDDSDDLTESQRLPRRFRYQFTESLVGDTKRVQVLDLDDGRTIGANLSDNSYEDDGYRFHDVMHLAFVAKLGWSPVWRKLLRDDKEKPRRTTNRTAPLDTNEDGGRGQVIDEAIVAAAYEYAADHDFMNGVESIDWVLLRHIRKLTARLEVSDRTAYEWNETLLDGFRVWRLLNEHGGGVVEGDLLTRELRYTPLP